MIEFTSKLPHIGTTIFTTMSALAVETGAVNLGQGFPDFECDPRLLERMNRAMAAGHNQYPPMTGIPALREQIAIKVEQCYRRAYDVANEITVTAGATQAIQTALTAIVHPGDEVIVLEPVYDSYEPVIRMNGGIARASKLMFPDYRPNWDEIRALIGSKTRAIMINTPHNPTATVWSRDDFDQLAELIRDTHIIVISDEVYEHMVFDGRAHASVSSHAELSERAFVISSFGKTYHVTGWKIAYCLAPKALMTEFRKTHQFVVFTVHTPSQHAIAEYMKLSTHRELSAFYQAKRDFFLEHVASSPLKWKSSRGTYFVLAEYGHLTEHAGKTDAEFSEWLTREIGVACIPVSAFYADGEDHRIVRFCFAKREETLRRAAERLAKL
jgi:methionine aminotransferase